MPAKKTNDGRSKGNMDAKKFTGLLVAVVLAVPIIATAPPGTLALMEIGLVGLFCVMRRRRSTLEAAR